MVRDTKKIVSIQDKVKEKKQEYRKLQLEHYKKKLKEWGQFAGLLFITWLIMKSCSQLPL